MIFNKKALREGFDGTGLSYRGERCGSDWCRGKRVGVGFNAPNELWGAVNPSCNVLCFSCFDALAQAKGIAYEVKDLEFYPVSWNLMNEDDT